jgi:acyl carrier protein
MKITVSRIRDAFKVDLPFEALFTARTVSTLAELIENAEGRSVDDAFEEGSA